MLSGLSLNDISNISVLALPISLEEVESIGSQLTFARILLGAQELASPNGHDSQFLSSSIQHEILLRPTSREAVERRPHMQTQAERTPTSLPVSTSSIPPRLPILKAPIAGKRVLYKLVVLGDGGTGTTALTIQVRLTPDLLMNDVFDTTPALTFEEQLCLNHFVESYDPTIEDSYRKQAVIDGHACMLEILDTAGQEEYTALRDQWIRDGEGFVIVYSITSHSSFRRVQRFHHQVQRIKEAASYADPPVPIMLVGNNSDRVTEREVSTQQGHAMARELGCEFVEASARNCINVEKAFYDVVRILRRQRQNQQLQQSLLPHPTPRHSRYQRLRKPW